MPELARSARSTTVEATVEHQSTAHAGPDSEHHEVAHRHLGTLVSLAEPGSISADFLAKVPGPRMRLGEAHMAFSYADAFGGPAAALEPYERLIHDAMIGDRTLFTTSSGIERLWEISTPLLENPPPLDSYEPGSWGPPAMDDLIAPRRWHLPNSHV